MIQAALDTRAIPKPDGVRKTYYEDGGTWDIIKVILMADNKLGQYMCDFASQFEKSYAGLYDLWSFVHNNIRYVADRPGLEKVKDPRVTWKDGYGDCKSFSLFLASVLKCLGIKYRYRFAAYGRSEEPTHVYIVATLNNREVILDSVHDTFDEEVEFYKKWDRVTRIVHLHGVPMVNFKAKPTRTQRIADAPRQAAPSRNIIPAGLTEGALTLELLDDQIVILMRYYGDPDGILQKARNLIFRARRGSFHYDNTLPTGYVDSRLNDLIAQIQKASQNTRISGTNFKLSGIGTLEYNKPKLYPKNCKDLISNEYQKLLNEFNLLNSKVFKGGLTRSEEDRRFELLNFQNDLKKDLNECALSNEFAELTAKSFDKSAHHLLYEFITDANSATNIVATKSVLHKTGIATIGQLAHIDRSNIRLMCENGILRTNSGLKLPNEIGITPGDAIKVLKDAAIQNYSGPSIGEPISVVAVAIVKIIGALITAISAFSLLMQQMNESKRIQLQSKLPGAATPDFSADYKDFIESSSSSGLGSFSKYLPYALVGGAALFIVPSLLKSK
ncbi:MAG: transglutaminase domain-containing protein [Saprospiraceae bacterium]|nr:transglutaminase domain-containing protein [Saprospiraceae bacterium]